MRPTPAHAAALAFVVLAIAAPVQAQDAGVPFIPVNPFGPQAPPRSPRRRPPPVVQTPAVPAQAVPAQAVPAQAVPAQAPAPPLAAPPPVGPAVPESTPPAAADAPESAQTRESREERERWRIPSDLVNPFLDVPRFDGGRAARERDPDAASWFIAEEDLVDPWRNGRLGPFYGVRCSGRWCRADPRSAVYIAAGGAPGRRSRRGHTRRIELAALVSASTVAQNARARIEAQITVHRGAFGVGLSLSTSTGDVRVAGVDVTHSRHAFALVLEHRFTDGTVMLDFSAAAGLMVSELGDAQVAPVARVMTTVGIPLAHHVELIVRGDALTTFIRPGNVDDGGPSAFEFGMGLGLRIATD